MTKVTGGLSLATANGLYVPKSILTAADSLITASGAGVPVELPVAASRIIGKKSSGGLVALTPAEAAAIITVPVSMTFGGTPGVVGTGLTVFINGHTSTAIGIIPGKNFGRACTILGIQGVVLASGVTGAVTGTINVYKNATSGAGNLLFSMPLNGGSNLVASTLYGFSQTTPTGGGASNAFNGTTDYFTVGCSCAGGGTSWAGAFANYELALNLL